MEMTDNEFREETDRIWKWGYENAEKDLKPKLDAALLQVHTMQEIVDAAMNENMPRIRAATKAYQDLQHQSEKQVERCGHNPQCPADKRIEPSPKEERICTKCGGDHLEALTCQERNCVYER